MIDIFVSVACRRCTNLQQLVHLYDLKQYFKDVRVLASDAAVLQMMILHPAFMIRLPFIVSEFFRKSGYSYMLYKLCHSAPVNWIDFFFLSYSLFIDFNRANVLYLLSSVISASVGKHDASRNADRFAAAYHAL